MFAVAETKTIGDIRNRNLHFVYNGPSICHSDLIGINGMHDNYKAKPFTITATTTKQREGQNTHTHMYAWALQNNYIHMGTYE